MAAHQDRFARLERIADTPLPGVIYAFHFDASLYAAYLRRLAQRMGVRRVEGMIAEVLQNPESGDVSALRLKDGREISGELFIDCTGFRGLLIERTLKVGYDDWTRWLPVDRALAIPTERVGPLTPYTRSTALEAGWQWRIPLQHRTGNGHVYSSAFVDDDRAAELLMANLDSRPLADPRPIRFVTGRRRQLWSHNVVCLGLASGFLEPLESTTIHLIQANIQRLVLLFPHHGDCNHRRAQFNQAAAAEYEYVRDFIILHYYLNNRVGERFWDECRHMSVPDSLTHKIELFRETGGIFPTMYDLFHRSEEHTSELQSRVDLVCRLLLEKKKRYNARFRDDGAPVDLDGDQCRQDVGVHHGGVVDGAAGQRVDTSSTKSAEFGDGLSSSES